MTTTIKKYRVNGKRRLLTHEEAQELASEIHRRTGVFVAVEEARDLK